VPSPASGADARPTTGDRVTELRELVVGYAKQETVDPLKSLFKYLGLGLGGAALIGLGWMFLLLGLLRALESIDWFGGPTQRNGWHGSWLIYSITIVAGLVVVGASLMAARRSTKRRRGGR
jgi:hypothetical protein